MIYESRFNNLTRGLVAGPALLEGFPAGVVPIKAPQIKRGLSLNRREFIVDETFRDLRLDPSPLPWIRTYKVVVRAREGGEELWVRPFANQYEALLAYTKLIGFDLERIVESGKPWRCPPTWIDDELEYIFATVDQFTATGSATWSPIGILSGVDYLVIAGGGGGGCQAGGGGAGGGFLTATNAGITTRNVTVGVAGTGAQDANGDATPPTNGGDSVFAAITSTGGGFGATASGTGNNGGSGGGGGGISTANGGTGTVGQGHNGGAGTGAGQIPGGGGGGATAVGANGSGSTGGAGGAGTASSITGSSVTYSSGGGAGANNASGVAGSGGTNAGSGTNNATTAGAGTANRGGGGGGGGNVGGNSGGHGVGYGTGGAGGTGFVALSYTVTNIWNRPQIMNPILAQ